MTTGSFSKYLMRLTARRNLCNLLWPVRKAFVTISPWHFTRVTQCPGTFDSRLPHPACLAGISPCLHSVKPDAHVCSPSIYALSLLTPHHTILFPFLLLFDVGSYGIKKSIPRSAISLPMSRDYVSRTIFCNLMAPLFRNHASQPAWPSCYILCLDLNTLLALSLPLNTCGSNIIGRPLWDANPFRLLILIGCQFSWDSCNEATFPRQLSWGDFSKTPVFLEWLSRIHTRLGGCSSDPKVPRSYFGYQATGMPGSRRLLVLQNQPKTSNTP